MKNQQPFIETFGDCALRFVWKGEINKKTNRTILSWQEQLLSDLGELIQEITISYNELVVYLHDESKQELLLDKLKTYDLRGSFDSPLEEESKIYIPVCYHDDYGLDLQLFCEYKSIEKKELIDLHTSVEYPVYFIGFLPGFPYLGGLNERLHQERRTSPRKSVPAGAVGIAGAQTGIYPSSSPGGWNIIGRCPMPLFNPDDETATLLSSGDSVVFYSVDKEHFENLEKDLSLITMKDLRANSHKIYLENHD